MEPENCVPIGIVTETFFEKKCFSDRECGQTTVRRIPEDPRWRSVGGVSRPDLCSRSNANYTDPMGTAVDVPLDRKTDADMRESYLSQPYVPSGTAGACDDTSRQGFVSCMANQGYNYCDSLALYLSINGFRNGDDEFVTKTYCSTAKGFEWSFKEGVPIALTIYAGGASIRTVYLAYKAGGAIPALITAADEAVAWETGISPRRLNNLISPAAPASPSTLHERGYHPTPGERTISEGGTYQYPKGEQVYTGSTGNFSTRYSPEPYKMKQFPQERFGPAAADSAYNWTPRRQRRFDEMARWLKVPPERRWAPSRPTAPVDPEKWEKYKHIFGY